MKNGIGYQGKLPWKGLLPNELRYFTRVTKATPVGSTGVMNAVIMGRTSWDALPAIVQPLPGRINVVITRSPEAIQKTIQEQTGHAPYTHVVSSLEEGLQMLKRTYEVCASQSGVSMLGDQATVKLGRIFVIGGTEIFNIALERADLNRILLTSIFATYNCDTFFPILRNASEDSEWVQQSHSELLEWTGEGLAEGRQTEDDVEYEFMMFKRRQALD